MTTITAAPTPLEWLKSLGNSLNEFYEAQCRAFKAKKASVNHKVPNSAVKKISSTIQKPTIAEKRRSSLVDSTPLKGKSPTTNSILINEPSTPLTSVTATPFTEARSRRTAATKADKYIDIVSRRLAEVPANGSTPKSMKIASKLISEATPNSRRNILLSSTAPVVANRLDVQSTPKSTVNGNVSVVPAATPASVRKRNRTAKIRQLFETPLLSLASAANTVDNNSAFSPSSVIVAPSTISKTSKLSQVHTIESSPIKKVVSPVKKTVSPVKKVASPVKKVASPAKKVTSPVKKSPVRRSPRVSPFKAVAPIPSAPQVSATPRAPLVEFVAPQSVLRSSKRPRKQGAIFNDDTSNTASPAMAKHARITNDSSIFPTVNFNSQTHVKIAPQTPIAPVVTVVPPSVRTSNINVPAIIVPLSNVKPEVSNSAEDLSILSSKRTPLRVQPPAKTPTRAKAVIPSLSDYSAAAKIAVIEVSKNTQNNANMANNTAATPKVEPWTNRFMQKDKDAPVPSSTPVSTFNIRSSLNINVKPVDTSKISGFSNAAAPIVPKFPLNLANISNITKTSTSTGLSVPAPSITVPSANTTSVDTISVNSSSVNTFSVNTSNAPPPESPLTRAKRIDLENSSREEKIKNLMEQKAEKMKKANDTSNNVNNLHNVNNVNNNSSSNNSSSNSANNTSKLPVKPSPKIPSRLAEAFSGIDSELPPIDIGLVDDEKVLKGVLSGNSAVKERNAPSGFVNPKMKKNPQALSVASSTSSLNNNINSIASTPTASIPTGTQQLHRTAVLNSAARKITTNNAVTTNLNVPSTPKPAASTSAKTDSSSPFLPEIPSDDELERREKMKSNSGKENRPTWATTPNLAVALNAQRSQRAEDVFGKVQPIKLEDFFKGSGKKFPNRSSTSNWNNNI